MKPLLTPPYLWWLIGAVSIMSIVILLIKNLKLPSISFGQKAGPRVSFSNAGRSGEAFYESREGKFRMYWEFGGGDVLVSINVPNPRNWVAKTGIPLEQRASVLNYIAQQAIETQNGGRGRFEIEENFIVIYG